MITIPAILVLMSVVLYTHPPILKSSRIVIQLSKKIAKKGKGILFSYFFDLKRKTEKIAFRLNIINLKSGGEKKRIIRIIANTKNAFWILFKSPRTLKSFLKIQFQLLHHRFSLSINKFTIFNQ